MNENFKEQEPVAWMVDAKERYFYWIDGPMLQGHRDTGHKITPLYARPQAAQPAAQVLRPMGEGNEWYFDCDGHYIDVARDSAGKYSVYFRNQIGGSEAFYDQAQPAAQVAGLTDAEDAARWRKARSLLVTNDFPHNWMRAQSVGEVDRRLDSLRILAAKSAPADGDGV